MKRITKIEADNSKNKRRLRVAAYARVSTDSEDQLISLEAQKNHYERLIRSHREWDFAGLYYDEGISGTKTAKREGLLRMISDCEKGLIDYIIVKSISRFSRNTVDSLEMVRKLCNMGIFILFEKEKIDTGKMESELLLSILSSLAESESHSISQNETWSIKQRFIKGTYKIPYPPYGYDYSNGKMIVNPKQSEVVRYIFSQVLSGKSTGSIAKELEERGVPSKKGGKWTGHTVKGIIRNEKYTGDVIFQKTYTDDNFVRHRNNGERDKYYAVNHHEAIVSHEDFDVANAILDKNGSEKGVLAQSGKYNNRYCFSGKIICSECRATWKRIRIAGKVSYGCNTHIKNKEDCNMLSIRDDYIKAAFTTMMNKLIFARKNVLVPYYDRIKETQRGEKIEGLTIIEEKLEDNSQKRKKLTQFLTKGFIEPAFYAKQNDELVREYEKLMVEKENVISSISVENRVTNALEDILRFTAGAEKKTEFDEELFNRFVEKIIIYSREEIGFVMKCGPVFRERLK